MDNCRLKYFSNEKRLTYRQRRTKNLDNNLIPLTQWAQKIGMNPDNERQKAGRGSLPAVKIGRQWFIDADQKNEDARVKSGKYKNWRKK